MGASVRLKNGRADAGLSCCSSATSPTVTLRPPVYHGVAGPQHQTRQRLINSAPSAAPRSNAEQHQKTITVDDTTAAVGTGNQDGVFTCAKKSCSPTTRAHHRQ